MKTYISDSLISEALIVMQAMKQYNCFEVSKVKEIRTYYGINKQAAINLAIQCEWLVEKNGMYYTITPYGEGLLKNFDGMQVRLSMYRDILYNGTKPAKPVIVVPSNDFTVEYNGKIVQLKQGTARYKELKLKNGHNYMIFHGLGQVSLYANLGVSL